MKSHPVCESHSLFIPVPTQTENWVALAQICHHCIQRQTCKNESANGAFVAQTLVFEGRMVRSLYGKNPNDFLKHIKWVVPNFEHEWKVTQEAHQNNIKMPCYALWTENNTSNSSDNNNNNNNNNTGCSFRTLSIPLLYTMPAARSDAEPSKERRKKP